MSAAHAPVAGVDLDIEQLMRLRASSRRDDARRFTSSTPSGGAIRRRRGRGAETFDVRPWSEGDDVRSLDRNVTARTGAPHVRTFHDERERSILHVVDLRPSMFFGTRRAFRSVAAAEASVVSAWRALDAQARVGLAVATSRGARFLGAAASARRFPPLLLALVEAHRAALEEESETADPPLADALDELERVAGSSAMVLATALDAPGERFDAVAERIARRRDFSVLLVADRFETAPPPGLYPFRMREAGGVLHIARGAPPPPDARQTRLRRLGAHCLEIDAGEPTDTILRALERFYGRSV